MSLFVDVVFNLPLQDAFTYATSNIEQKLVVFGKRAIVPFGKRELIAFIINTHCDRPSFDCREVIKLIDEDELAFYRETLYFAKWIADYYICSLGEALSLFVPKREIKKKNKKQNDDPKNNEGEKEANIASQQKDTELSTTQENRKDNFLILNDEQRNAFDKVADAILNDYFAPYLLFGITGSGKTEVYKRLALMALSKKRKALILVPEIALTPQTIAHFKKSFDEERIAVLHSKISLKERYYYWKKIENNEIDIILGARSAIFSSVTNIGIIILDEEHEASYKSQDTPRYHARQFAFKLSKRLNIPLLLGSATPSVETYFYAIEKNISLLMLEKRHSVYKKQLVHIVDMKKEVHKSFISKMLFEKISDRIFKREQVIIFLNKRGHSPVAICKDCGQSIICPNCDISLTYHKKTNRLLCHYCSYSLYDINTCLNCSGHNISLAGYGTQKVEEELKQSFPKASIMRMDLDSTKQRGSYEKILEDFQNNKIDILVGTQMLTKGLHFPNLTLVGVLLADLSLHLPDFRATERTFALLTQISGRAGRGSILGEVVIQTYLPDHYVIKTAREQDYKTFYLREIKEREKFFYPPFSRIIKLLVRGKDEDKVLLYARKVHDLIKSYDYKEVAMLGPAMAPISKINNNFRAQIILKSKKQAYLQKIALQISKSLKKDRAIYLEIDIDPISLM